MCFQYLTKLCHNVVHVFSKFNGDVITPCTQGLDPRSPQRKESEDQDPGYKVDVITQSYATTKQI